MAVLKEVTQILFLHEFSVKIINLIEYWVNRYGDKLSFNEKGVLICPKSNEKYHLSNNQIKNWNE